jgi:hypothetical protein
MVGLTLEKSVSRPKPCRYGQQMYGAHQRGRLAECSPAPLMYASGVPRGPTGLFGRPALEPSRIFFVHPNEFDQVFDTELGERLDAIFSDAIDLDDT